MTAIDEIHIPGYDLKEFIAKGGMSSVYRARQHIFERDIALKIMRQDLSDEENFIERFMQESLIVAKLHHSHIVHVYDVGEVSNHCFIAMEFLSGGVLKAKMANGMPIKKSVSILKQIASALDFSHQKGIVHRDIKPDNIMFREDGAAVLTDFGIAKDRSADMELTQTGAIMGTPKYMAPEQIKGEVIGPATDLYSLGIVFYEMLTGFVPFPGSDFVSIAHKHISDPIPQFSGYLTPFQYIIDKLLAKEPGERFARAGEIYLALDEIADYIANPQVEDTIVSSSSTFNFTVGTYGSLSGKTPKGATATVVGDQATSDEEQSENENTVRYGKRRKKILVGASVGCLVLLSMAGIYWQSTIPEKVGIISPGPVATSGLQTAEEKITDLLSGARVDVNNNRLTRPENLNALAKYRQVLSLEQNNDSALQGIVELTRLLAGRGMEHLQAGEEDEAANLLRQAQSLGPEEDSVRKLEDDLNTRLTEINDTQQNILSMRDEIRIDGLLGMVERDLEEGRVNTPPGNNALEKLQQVLRIDPNNQIAKEKLDELE